MAADIPGLLPEAIRNPINQSKVLVVGAGGIGCELLKNLVLTGFKDVHIVSPSNLQAQLFPGFVVSKINPIRKCRLTWTQLM